MKVFKFCAPDSSSDIGRATVVIIAVDLAYAHRFLEHFLYTAGRDDLNDKMMVMDKSDFLGSGIVCSDLEIKQ